jgi:hypothetical protein
LGNPTIKRAMRSFLVLLFMGSLLVVERAALAAPLGSNEFAAVIQGSNSLRTLRGLIGPSNYELMGFGAVGEVLTATNGAPLLIYTVPLNRLVNYQPPHNFDGLLDPNPQTDPAPVTRVIIPIMVSTNLRCSLTLRLEKPPGQPERWTNANWGYSGLIKDLMATYRMVTTTEPLKAGWSPFVVEIPVFDIWLIGYYDPQDALILRATTDMRLGSITIHRHEIVTHEAMHELAITSQRYNGLPN